MTYPPYVRDKARKLRSERKLTIDEIAERLAVSRTTVYSWVRDLPIPPTPRSIYGSAEGRRKGNLTIQRRFAALRAAAYVEGWAEFSRLAKEPTFTDFVCMYIGEGYKRTRNNVALGNSDPKVILLADYWINRLTTNVIRYSVQYHADQDHRELQRFWSELVGVDPEQIILQRKSNSGQLTGRNWRSRHGVLTIATGDTRFRMRLQAWIDQVKASWLDSLTPGA